MSFFKLKMQMIHQSSKILKCFPCNRWIFHRKAKIYWIKILIWNQRKLKFKNLMSMIIIRNSILKRILSFKQRELITIQIMILSTIMLLSIKKNNIQIITHLMIISIMIMLITILFKIKSLLFLISRILFHQLNVLNKNLKHSRFYLLIINAKLK